MPRLWWSVMVTPVTGHWITFTYSTSVQNFYLRFKKKLLFQNNSEESLQKVPWAHAGAYQVWLSVLRSDLFTRDSLSLWSVNSAGFCRWFLQMTVSGAPRASSPGPISSIDREQQSGSCGGFYPALALCRILVTRPRVSPHIPGDWQWLMVSDISSTFY